MSTVDLPSSIPLYDPAAAKVAKKGSNQLGTSPEELQDNFMRMLVEQMKNQDPLNPADSSQFTSELAQLNTVKGIETLNNQFTSFLSQVQAADFLNSASLVGQKALVSGNALVFNGSPVEGAGTLATDAASVKVSILDANGALVDQYDYGSASAGKIAFSWDGTTSNGAQMPAGRYQFKIDATDASGRAVAATTQASVQVASVQRSTSGTKLALTDGRVIAASDVQEWTN